MEITFQHKNMDMINAIVIGAIHHNTLGVVRSLGEAGITREHIIVLLIGSGQKSSNLISSSKYVIPDNVHCVESYEDIVSWLDGYSFAQGKSVIVCCSDGAAGEVIKANNDLQNRYFTPSTTVDVNSLMEKSTQDEYAKKCGMDIPYSSEYDVDAIVDWNIFPCIIKPYKCATAKKTDIHIIHCKEELDSVLSTLQSERIQIQQYIEKTMEFQLIGCSLDAGEKIIIPGFTNIIRQPKTTNTGYLLYSPIEQLEFNREAVETFIRTIGYSGLFSIEFIRGKDGKDYFLEINMRNDGNAYCVESAGVNLPYIWVYYQTYGKLPDVPTSFKDPIYFIPDLNDLKLAIREIGILKWVKQFREAESHSIYNKKDMGPFRYEIIRQVKKVLRIH